jgi:lipopolysaccharide export system permease protein
VEAQPGARSEFSYPEPTQARLQRYTEAEYDWPPTSPPTWWPRPCSSPIACPPSSCSATSSHLQSNGQAAQKYEIEFWRKVFYPLSCLVMVVLALPFAYLHFRSGGIAGYVFGGVMAGISFFLLNNVFGYAGNLQNWRPG